jgi:predicted amino acid-binding ACT domain protein
MTSMQNDLIDIKSKMPALITSQGVPTDSPLSASERVKMKEELNKEISELNVRIRILEEHEKRK